MHVNGASEHLRSTLLGILAFAVMRKRTHQCRPRNLTQAKRGTPCYMAPELFSEGATHSTASDLWSLGCVLYECATGSPPFMDSSFNKLVRDILHKDPAPIAGGRAR